MAGGTWSALLAQVTSAAFTAGVTLYLVRALGPEGYGELTLVLSVAGLAVVVADGALAQSTGRWTAQVCHDVDAAARVVAAGLRLKLWLAAITGLALLAVAGPVARGYGAPGMATALRWSALAVVAESLFLLWAVTFQSLRRVGWTVRLYFLESLAEAVAVVGLVALGGGVAGAVAGRGVGYLVGSVAGLFLLGRLLGRRLPRHDSDPQARRRIGGYAVPLFVNTGTWTAYSQVDVQLTAALLDRTAVGLFSAPARLLTLLGYPGQALANAVSPRMAGPDPDVHAFRTGMRLVLLYQAVIVPPVVLWADPLCRLLLGDAFAGSAPVLAALSPYLYLRGVSILAATTVNYLGFARRRIPIVLLALVVNVGLCLLLLPRIGVVGAAVALGASYALYVPLHLRLCALAFPVPVAALCRTVARSGVAAAGTAGVLLLVGTRDLSAGQWLAGSVGGALVYVLLLLLTGEFDENDRAVVRRFVSGTARHLVRRG